MLGESRRQRGLQYDGGMTVVPCPDFGASMIFTKTLVD